MSFTLAEAGALLKERVVGSVSHREDQAALKSAISKLLSSTEKAADLLEKKTRAGG